MKKVLVLALALLNPSMALATIMSIQVTGCGKAPLSISPRSVAFGNVETGTVVTRSITITNITNTFPVPRTITGAVSVISPCPGLVLVTPSGLSLAPGVNKVYSIQFAPGIADTIPVNCQIEINYQ